MNISSAYLFATQISPGDIPPEQEVVFFENGVFNRRHIPTGFDFENNVLRIVAERDEEITLGQFKKAAYWDFEQGVHGDHLDDGTTFIVYSYAANNVESFTLDHTTGYLVFDHPTYRTSVDRFNCYAQLACIMPISNLSNTFDYICMRCRCVVTGYVENNPQFNFEICERDDDSINSVRNDFYYIRPDLDGKEWADIVIDNSYFREKFDFLRFCFMAVLESYDYDIGDIPFQIEISKIWFTNTPPE